MQLQEYRIQIQVAVKKLRKKYEGDKAKNAMLSNIIWYSFPIVYDMGEPGRGSAMYKAQKEIDATKRRRARIRRYVREMVEASEKTYLLTLTFGDCYESTTRKTRDSYAKDYLASICEDYMASLDIGKSKGREHYHAIVTFPYWLPIQQEKVGKKTFYRLPDNLAWKHGYYTLIEIKRDESDVYKTLNYAFKATSYAFKASSEEKKIKPFHKRSGHKVVIGEFDEIPW